MFCQSWLHADVGFHSDGVGNVRRFRRRVAFVNTIRFRRKNSGWFRNVSSHGGRCHASRFLDYRIRHHRARFWWFRRLYLVTFVKDILVVFFRRRALLRLLGFLTLLLVIIGTYFRFYFFFFFFFFFFFLLDDFSFFFLLRLVPKLLGDFIGDGFDRAFRDGCFLLRLRRRRHHAVRRSRLFFIVINRSFHGFVDDFFAHCFILIDVRFQLFAFLFLFL